MKKSTDIFLRVMFVLSLLAILVVVIARADEPKPAPASKPSEVQLTDAGTLAYKTIAQELQQLQKDINVLVTSEVKAQGLTGNCQLDVYRGMIICIPIPPPPRPRPAPAPTPPTPANKK